MTTRPFIRVLSALLVTGLFAAIPATPAEASRPVCRTSKTAKIPVNFDRKVPWQGHPGDPSPRGRGCVKDGVLVLELRQKYFSRTSALTSPWSEVFGLGSEIVLYVRVHFTTSNGRYLNQVVFTDEIWLGNPRELFRDEGGRVMLLKRLPEVDLPDLAAGTYQASFELVLKSSGGFNETRLSSGTASTGPTHIKVKVS